MSYFNPGKRGWSASGRELARCWGGHDQGHGTEVLGGWGRAEHPAWKRTRAVLVPCAHLKCSGSRQKVPPGLAFKSNRNSNMERGKKRGKKKKAFFNGILLPPEAKRPQADSQHEPLPSSGGALQDETCWSRSCVCNVRKAAWIAQVLKHTAPWPHPHLCHPHTPQAPCPSPSPGQPPGGKSLPCCCSPKTSQT